MKLPKTTDVNTSSHEIGGHSRQFESEDPRLGDCRRITRHWRGTQVDSIKSERSGNIAPWNRLYGSLIEPYTWRRRYATACFVLRVACRMPRRACGGQRRRYL